MSNLTDIQKDILVNIMEEAAEVIQACSKMLRFGNNDEPHREGVLNNRDYLSRECGNLDEAIYMGTLNGLINQNGINEGIAAKREKWSSKSNV